jgi:hypothetical protein
MLPVRPPTRRVPPAFAPEVEKYLRLLALPASRGVAWGAVAERVVGCTVFGAARWLWHRGEAQPAVPAS